MAAELSLAGAAGNIGTSMLWEGDRWPCSPTPLLSPWYAVHPLHLLLYQQPHTSGRKELVQLRWWEHSLLCALQPPVHYLGCAGGVAAPSLQSRHSLPAVSLRVVLLLSQWGRALIQLQGASSPGGLPGMAQYPHPTQPSRPGPGGGAGGHGLGLRWTSGKIIQAG